MSGEPDDDTLCLVGVGETATWAELRRDPVKMLRAAEYELECLRYGQLISVLPDGTNVDVTKQRIAEATEGITTLRAVLREAGML